MDNITNNLTNKGIYKITCLSNNKFYIGSSTNIRYRIRRHFNELRQNIHLNRYMQSSFNKYGECNFIIECIESCSKEITDKDLLNLEQKYLDALKPYNESIGFNICQKAAFPPNRKGKKLSDSHKQNISKARKGITHKVVSSLKGKSAKQIHGPDWIDSRKGKTAKEIYGSDWVDPRKGKTYKEIYGSNWKLQCQKLSRARKGRVFLKP
jgi:group I intron endonuclease